MQLDTTFIALGDSTRRQILNLVAQQPLSVSEIASNFSLKYGTISKHIIVLEAANLIRKKRSGKSQYVSLVPENLEQARLCLEAYRQAWEERLDSLELFIIK